MHRLPRLAALALFIPLLAGCLSIPISTLYKMSQMSDDNFRRMDPAQLRVAVDLPADVPVDLKKIVVGFCFHKVEGDAGTGGAWPVGQIAEGTFVAAALPTVKADRRLHLFRLADEAQAKLDAILALWRADKNAFQKVNVDVRLNAGDPPPQLRRYRTSGWFQISREQGYLQMLDDYQVDVDDPSMKSPDKAQDAPFQCG